MPDRLHAACVEFEAAVLRTILRDSFSRLGTTGLSSLSSDDDRPGDDRADASVFGSLVVETLAGGLARSGGIGLAKELERWLSRTHR